MKLSEKIFRFCFISLIGILIFINSFEKYSVEKEINLSYVSDNSDFKTILENGFFRFGEILNSENSLTNAISTPRIFKFSFNFLTLDSALKYDFLCAFHSIYILNSKCIFLKINSFDIIFPFNYFW